MQVTINIPEEVAKILEVKLGNLSQQTLEALAIEGYRQGVLTRGQIQQMLNLSSFYEVEKFLKQKNVNLNYDLTDLEHDIQVVHRLESQ